ncbi:MAG: methylmalonyl-CoA mutase family protein, partial [Pseudonocardiaceae bacterium]
HETGLTSIVDPLAGSYALESMTDEIETAALTLMAKVDEMGGAVHAIEAGFQKAEIERSAYRTAVEIDSGERVVVGLNRYRLDAEDAYQPLRVDPAIEDSARARLAALRAARSSVDVGRALDELRRAAKDTDSNLLYPMKQALAARATVGEVCHALREVWGSYVPPDTF